MIEKMKTAILIILTTSLLLSLACIGGAAANQPRDTNSAPLICKDGTVWDVQSYKEDLVAVRNTEVAGVKDIVTNGHAAMVLTLNDKAGWWSSYTYNKTKWEDFALKNVLSVGMVCVSSNKVVGYALQSTPNRNAVFVTHNVRDLISGNDFKELDIENVTDLSTMSRGNAAFVLKNDGTVWKHIWQYSYYNSVKYDTNEWEQVEPLRNVISISAGSEHCMALLGDGTVWTWGDNWDGQLGNSSFVDSDTPTKVENLENIVKIFAGNEQSYAVDSSGALWGWGYNSKGRVGIDPSEGGEKISTPVKISTPEKIESIKIGNINTVAISTTGHVYFWGTINGENQIYQPTQVKTKNLDAFDVNKVYVTPLQDLSLYETFGDGIPENTGRATELLLDVDNGSYSYNSKANLSPSYTPFYENEEFTESWESSRPDIATVSSEGEICAKKPGVATITATVSSDSGSKKVSCNVIVSNYWVCSRCSGTGQESLLVTHDDGKRPYSKYIYQTVSKSQAAAAAAILRGSSSSSASSSGSQSSGGSSCSSCHGSGIVTARGKCGFCSGTGKYVSTTTDEKISCRFCGGSGNKIPLPCPRCGGCGKITSMAVAPTEFGKHLVRVAASASDAFVGMASLPATAYTYTTTEFITCRNCGGNGRFYYDSDTGEMVPPTVNGEYAYHLDDEADNSGISTSNPEPVDIPPDPQVLDLPRDSNDDLDSISLVISTPPNKTQYVAGETFDPTGMTVDLVFSDGTKMPRGYYEVSPSGMLKESDTSVKVSTTINGDISLTATQPITVSARPTVNPFTDVKESDLFCDAVLWAYYAEPQVTNGISATLFNPTGIVTRGQCVTFLWRAMGQPEPSSRTNPFVDVLPSDYYYKAVLWAVEKNITKGTDATHFSPRSTLSTAHIATFLYRTLGIGIDGWYQDAAAWAKNENLVSGLNTTIAPNVDCPRSSVVLFLYRELGK